jgi:hypothetical protein
MMPLLHLASFPPGVVDQTQNSLVLTDGLRKRYAAVVTVAEPAVKLPETLSRFKAPVTVRVALDRAAKSGSLVVHLVNYARQPEVPNLGRGGADEKPADMLPLFGVS